MDNRVFDGGPPIGLEVWLRLRKRGDGRYLRFALGAVAITWLPLFFLTWTPASLLHWPAAGSFIADIAVHARYLLAVPLLILAEATCIPQLGLIAQHFLDADIVIESERGQFGAALVSTRKWRDSWIAECAVIACAYLIVLSVSLSDSQRLPEWMLSTGHGASRFSPAGWWHQLVSLPALLMLLFGWVWRLFLWARLLWLVSRLNLHLLAVHPDRAAGLMFVGYSVRAWALPALAPGVIVAGTLANQIVYHNAPLAAFQFVIPGVAITLVLLCIAPLVVFSTNLVAAWRTAVLQYGALAERVGHRFERDWFARPQEFFADPMETQSFSATTDLYQVVSNVYAMRVLPVDLISTGYLALVVLLPFLPLVVISQPLGFMLEKLAGFLL